MVHSKWNFWIHGPNLIFPISLWLRKWHLHMVNCLSQNLGIVLCFSLSASPILNPSARSPGFASKIFFLPLHLLPSWSSPPWVHPLELTWMRHLLLLPSLAICLLSIHSDAFRLSLHHIFLPLKTFTGSVLHLEWNRNSLMWWIDPYHLWSLPTLLASSHTSAVALCTLLWSSSSLSHHACYFDCYFLVLKLFSVSFLWLVPHNSGLNSNGTSLKRSCLSKGRLM